MSGYIFKQILIQNFKYIPGNKPISVDFQNSNIVILGGQNGYGKTTLFDALELLLNGTIKHFNPDLLNRGTESLCVLANNLNQDIIVKGLLSNSDNETITLERKFKNNSNFSSNILWNDTEITQEELYSRLKTSANLFDIGTYISQSQSLYFLQNKYKNRKEQISSLLINPQITQKIQLLHNIQQKLKDHIEIQQANLKSKTEDSEKLVIRLEEQVKNIQAVNVICGENIRLFPDNEFVFDLVQIPADITFTEFIQPLQQIEGFVKNYDEYLKYIQNKKVSKALNIPMQTYMALFYAKQIAILNERQSLLNTIYKCVSLLEELKQQNWTIDNSTFSAIEISPEITDKLKYLIQTKQTEQKNLNQSDQVLLQLKKARTDLIKKFDKAAEQGTLQNNSCPLCGTKFDDIRKTFAETETTLLHIHEDGTIRISELESQIAEIFTSDIVPVLESFLLQNSDLLKINDNLNSCKNLSTEELLDVLKELGISDFYSLQTEPFNLEEFSTAFEKLEFRLQQCQKPNTIIISDEEIELYKSIHNTYYKNKPPVHSLEQLESKKQYIANQFLNDINKKLSDAKMQQNKISKELKKYEEKGNSLQETLKSLIKKYEDSNKEYQSILANAIKLPLMIYSGKIIQNYPLGLGINAVVRTNQLVFEPMTKDGVDVYNILSTGQLNGLAIAILLSVRNIYSHPDGLDVLLIDDPLQTIDDISAISLADLLVQQKIGQIILSTHEDQKARLLRFKFEQENLDVCERNMQKIYLDLKQN